MKLYLDNLHHKVKCIKNVHIFTNVDYDRVYATNLQFYEDIAPWPPSDPATRTQWYENVLFFSCLSGCRYRVQSTCRVPADYLHYMQYIYSTCSTCRVVLSVPALSSSAPATLAAGTVECTVPTVPVEYLQYQYST